MYLNVTYFPFFVLSAYFELGFLHYFCFCVIFILYVFIVLSNSLLVSVICSNRSLHRPMYVLLCSLFVNELWGATALFSFLLVQILKDSHVVPVPLCFLQIFCVYTYISIQFCNLAAMSYDRYVAICFPLQYNARMTYTKVVLLILVSWLYPFLAILVLISLSSNLHLCGNVIHKVYCDNFSIVKLSCSNTMANNVYGMLYTCTIVLLVLLNIYSYIEILRVCFCGSKQLQQKALSTCTPHIISLINISCGCLFEIIQNRFDMSRVPNMLRIFLSLYFLTCPPVLNPLLYGLNVSKIRITCTSVVLRKW